jgi:hypothetical protein
MVGIVGVRLTLTQRRLLVSLMEGGRWL